MVSAFNPKRAVNRPKMAPPAWPDARQSLHARRVLMLKGCVQPGLRPHIDAATARVLDALGIRAEVASSSGCCGAVQGHMGDVDGAKVRARRNIDAWWPYIDSGAPVEAVLVNASGCGAWVKDYDSLLADDPAYADKARRVVALVRDPGEMLPAWLPVLKRKLARKAAAGALGAFTFHPPCSLSHAQRLSSAAKPGPIESGLRELGFEVRLAVRDSHQCCGAGGAYSVLQPEMSRQLRDLKLQALLPTLGVTSLSQIAACDAKSATHTLQQLYTAKPADPDLVVRTSGEVRMSGFLPWQSAYSEYYFCDVFWPEFRRIDFLRALRSYAHRERRRGR